MKKYGLKTHLRSFQKELYSPIQDFRRDFKNKCKQSLRKILVNEAQCAQVTYTYILSYIHVLNLHLESLTLSEKLLLL